MSKQNSGNGKTPQGSTSQASPSQTAQANAADEKFRRESQEAMAGDLMTVGELAPTGVVATLPTPSANVPKIEDESPANSGPSDEPLQQTQAQIPGSKKEHVPGSSQILSMLAAGRINADEAERLLCALKNVAPGAPQALPYIGGADGPATREEIVATVQQVYGSQLAGMTRNNTEMLEVMGAMVEKIVRGLREPSDEEKAELARRKRDRSRVIKEQLEMLQQQRDIRDMCPHERSTADGKSHTCITALHNYIDNILRGTCSLCQDIMEPGHPSYKQVVMSHNLAVSSAA